VRYIAATIILAVSILQLEVSAQAPRMNRVDTVPVDTVPKENLRNWKSIEPRGSGFSIRFPFSPNHIPPTTSVPDLEAYLTRYRDVTYSLTVKIDGPISPDRNSYSKVVSSKTLLAGSCEVEESIVYHIDKHSTTYSRERLLNTSNRGYFQQVTSEGRDNLFSPSAEYFLDSLNVEFCRTQSQIGGVSKSEISSGTLHGGRLSPREIAKRTLSSFVLLTTKDENGKVIGIASGFFVKDNLIATNYHVVKRATRTFARLLGEKQQHEISGIAAQDSERDLALLRVSNMTAPSLPLETVAQLEVGDEIYVVGNPEGFEGTFSEGLVSSLRQVGPDWLIQISAPISHGSSGGPVLSSNGKVVAVAVGGYKDGQNLNFAIPVSYLVPLLSSALPPKRIIGIGTGIGTGVGVVPQPPVKKPNR
jgi:S1-C subfamily serine protease